MKLDIWTVVIIAVVILIIVIFYFVQSAKKKKEREDILQNSIAITNPGAGGTVNNLLSIRPYTDRIAMDLEAYSADTALYDELVELDNESIRNIWLDWDQRYKSIGGQPLAAAVYSGYSFTRCCTFGWDWTYHAKLFHDRLKQIGLS